MKQILCFGDSNTWGYNPKTGQRFPWGVRWTSVLQQKLGFEEYRIVEEGLCGRTTVFEDELRPGRRGSDVISFLLETHAPVDEIIIMLGTNDCKAVYNANETVIGKGIEKLLQIIYRVQPDIKILLISPIFLGDDVWRKEFDPEFNEKSVDISHKLKGVYESIAQEHKISFLSASDYASYSTDDMEHMDEYNHERLAEAIYENHYK